MGTPHAIIEVTSAQAPARFHAIIEIAGTRKAAPAQQALQLEADAAAGMPLPGAVTASPATILAELATGTTNLQQVETQVASAVTSETGEAGRPRRRRRPSVNPEVEAVSLTQVETAASASILPVEVAATDMPHPTRRRTRPQAQPSPEPLVQVETRTD
jgi:ribonuclease E